MNATTKTKSGGKVKRFMNRHSAKVIGAVGLGLIIAGLKFCTGGQEPPRQCEPQPCTPQKCAPVACNPPTKEVPAPCPEGHVCLKVQNEGGPLARGDAHPNCGNGVLEEGALIDGPASKRGTNEDSPLKLRYTESSRGRTKSGERVPDFWHVKVDDDGTTHVVNPCDQDREPRDGGSRPPEKVVEPPTAPVVRPPSVKVTPPPAKTTTTPFIKLTPYRGGYPGNLTGAIEDILQMHAPDLRKAGVSSVSVNVRIGAGGKVVPSSVSPRAVPGPVRSKLMRVGGQMNGTGEEMRGTITRGVSSVGM